MILITTKLNQQSGFETESAVLQITSYTVTETVQLVTGSTIPFPNTGKQISLNYSIFKDLLAFESANSPFQPVGFPYSIQILPATDDVINESFIYNQLRSKLNTLGYDAEWI